MIKYIFFPAFGDHWYKLANELYKKEVAKPILWLGDDIHYFKAYGLFGKDVIRDLEHRHYPYNIKNIEYNEYCFFINRICQWLLSTFISYNIYIILFNI